MAFEGVTIPPPYAGLDLVSPIDNMDPNYALELTNVFCGHGAPTVRLGYTKFNTTALAGNPIYTQEMLRKKDGTQLLVSITNTAIYSTTTAGVVSTVTAATPQIGRAHV